MKCRSMLVDFNIVFLLHAMMASSYIPRTLMQRYRGITLFDITINNDIGSISFLNPIQASTSVVNLTLSGTRLLQRSNSDGYIFQLENNGRKFVSDPGIRKVLDGNVTDSLSRLINIYNYGGNLFAKGPMNDHFKTENSISRDRDQMYTTKPYPFVGKIPQMKSLKSSTKSIKHVRNDEDMVVVYLKRVLKLSDSTLKSIIVNQSWMLYLSVKSIESKINVLKKFGFTEANIRRVVEVIPSILALDYRWSVPEKLLSIQNFFYLNEADAVNMVISYPYILTSSIKRNQLISDYLTNKVGFTPNQLKKSVISCPQLVNDGLNVISECWDVLTNQYNLNSKVASKLCVRFPYLLTKRTLKEVPSRLQFLESLDIDTSSQEFNSIIKRSPGLLYVSVGASLIPNKNLLSKMLNLNQQQLCSIIKLCPSFLSYNPSTLEAKINDVLFFLTGDSNPFQKVESSLQINDVLNRSEDINTESLNSEHTNVDSVDSFQVISNDMKLFKERSDVEMSAYRHEMTDNVISYTNSEYSQYDDTYEDSPVDSSNQRTNDLWYRKYVSWSLDVSLLVDASDHFIELYQQIDDHDDSSHGGQRFTDSKAYDVLRHHIPVKIASWLNTSYATEKKISKNLINDMLSVHKLISTLSFSQSEANIIIRRVPWVLQYRLERTIGNLAALTLSLGLTKAELQKILLTYPRILSLSVEGKISQCLQSLGDLAQSYVVSSEVDNDVLSIIESSRNGSSALESELKSLKLADSAIQSLISRRNDPVRILVRHLLIRLPNVIGIDINRLRKRVNELILAKSLNQSESDKACEVEGRLHLACIDMNISFKKIPTYLRRTDADLEKYLDKINRKTSLRQPDHRRISITKTASKSSLASVNRTIAAAIKKISHGLLLRKLKHAIIESRRNFI